MTRPGSTHWLHAGRTDVGLKRDNNEDALLADPEIGLFAVADGCGGQAFGEFASHAAIGSLRRLVYKAWSGDGWAWPAEWTDPSGGCSDGLLRQLLTYAVIATNRTVFRLSFKYPHLRGMATTLVVGLFHQDVCHIANVGDSRAYRFRAGRLERLTLDHTYVEDWVQAGSMTSEEARTSPYGHFITRSIGDKQGVLPDVASHKVQPGDQFLFCSDGLTDLVTDAEIESILQARHHLKIGCRRLINRAKDRGGRDNITVLLVQCPHVRPPSTPSGFLQKKGAQP